MTQKLGPLQTEWIRRLKSGEYKQGELHLRQAYLDGSTRFCCLGIACEVAIDNGIPVNTRLDDGTTIYGPSCSASLPPQVMRAMCFRGEYGRPRDEDGSAESLSRLNDIGRSFEFIADTVCEDPGQYFTEPA